jgi:hypothetical protein
MDSLHCHGWNEKASEEKTFNSCRRLDKGGDDKAMLRKLTTWKSAHI